MPLRLLAGLAFLMAARHAKSQSLGLTSLLYSDGPHIFYVDANQHVNQLWYVTSTGKWLNADLGGIAAPGSPLTSYVVADGLHVYYIDTNQHVNQLWWNGSSWVNQDLTAGYGGPLASAGTTLNNYAGPDGQHVFYIDANQNINQLWWTGQAEILQNLTAGAGAPTAAVGSGLTNFAFSDNIPHVLWIDPNGHLNQLWYQVSGFVYQDLTVATGGPASAIGDLTNYLVADGAHTYYIGANQDVNQLWWTGSAWVNQDLTAGYGGPAAMPGGGLANYSGPDGQHVFYIDVNQNINQLWWTGQQEILQNLTAGAGAPLTAPGSPLTNFALSDNIPHVVYIDTANHIEQLWYQGTGFVHQDLTATTGGPAAGGGATTTSPVETPPVPQPPPTPAPPPIPPPVVSSSATSCNDISGIWSDNYSDVYSLSQNGNLVSGSTTSYDTECGDITWTITGQATGAGAFSLTAFNPQPAVDACGQVAESGQANVTITSCSTAQAMSSGSGGGSAFAGGGGSGSGGSGTTTWSRTTNPPGLQVNVDLANDRVCVTPTTTQKPGSPTVTITSSSNGSHSLSQGTPQNGAACPGSALTYNLQRASLAPGQYGAVTANWDDLNVTVPVSFNVIGNTRFSQYNVPYGSQCPSNPQPVWVIYKMDNAYCYYESALMGSKFITQTKINGTGVSNSFGVIKGYGAGAANICLPGGNDNGSHTFFAVDAGGNPIAKVTGTCHNTVLSDGTNFPNPLVNNNPPAGTLATFPGDIRYACSDQIMMVDPGSNRFDLRTVQDACPGCDPSSYGPGTQWPSAVAHIDTFNSSQTCNPNDLGDYGNRVAIRLR
jgi:hypothetical protein